MFEKIHPYLRLMRFDRPIGIFLLLWPTLWAVWIAGKGNPDLKIIIVFIMGVILMRAAGCVINDIADRNFDKHIKRTANRPLAAGEISVKQAFFLFISLCLLSASLLFFLNSLSFQIALIALCLGIIYPFTKRFTYLPQFFLGAAWSMGIIMAFTAQLESIPLTAWLLYLASVLWTVAFDTMYAMADRVEDLKINIKSTAILFAKYDRIIIGVFQIMVLVLLVLIGTLEKFQLSYYSCIGIAGSFAIYQQYLIHHAEPDKCFRAFLNNNWFGLVVFIGIILR